MSPHDTALFVQRSSTGITLILLYVDDMIIIGDDSAGIRSLQHFLSQHFEMKDLGTLSYFLGLEVTLSSDGYYLSQVKYASDLLSKAGIIDIKIVSTPLEYNAKFTSLDGEPIFDATCYRQLVGGLSYLIITRLDISHAMGMVSKFMANMDAPQPTATPLYYDNCRAIHIAHNDVFHECTKHIEIDYHITRQHLLC